MTITVHCGDSRALLRNVADASVDSVVCDPPYELGFMGRAWDKSGIAYDVDLWSEVLRTLKPGGHLVAFGGTRTYHRMACAIEDAGFDIRDQLAWSYGSGFPKSLDAAKAIDRDACGCGGRRGKDHTCAATPEAEPWQGWGTALKPAWEPICLARKPLSRTVVENVLAHGTGALNIDGCRISARLSDPNVRNNPAANEARNNFGGGADGREPRAHGTPAARWPANIIHDGSDEVLAGFPETSSGGVHKGVKASGVFPPWGPETQGHQDSGSAARFFYSAKASKLDRLGSDHPTVKPVELMRWLVRLVTPPGGTVLDPFAGTGPTGLAALVEGFGAILMELRSEAVDDINRRIAHARGEGKTTAIEAAQLSRPSAARRARGADTPLFYEPDTQEEPK